MRANNRYINKRIEESKYPGVKLLPCDTSEIRKVDFEKEAKLGLEIINETPEIIGLFMY